MSRTVTVESRAATARMSAHETVREQTASTCALMLSTTLKPLSEPLLGNDPCSPVKLAVSTSSTDASQPCHKVAAGVCVCTESKAHCYIDELVLEKSAECRNREERRLAWTKQSWKWSLRRDAPMRGSLLTAAVTALLIVASALGHDVS
jgi:hypothetical protein